MTTTTTAAVPARKATRREWLGLIAIAFPCMIYSMDLTVLNLAVPTLTRELKPTAGELLDHATGHTGGEQRISTCNDPHRVHEFLR